jgi:hypothetical protein
MALSPRNQKALDGLHSLAGDGWDRSPNARRAERSGLTPKQWRSSVDALVAGKLVERLPGTDEERNRGTPDALRLTPAGLASAGMGGQGSGRGDGQGSGIPLGSCSSSLQVQEEKEEEPTTESGGGTPGALPVGRGGGQGWAGVEVRHVLDLGPETVALVERMLAPLVAGALARLASPSDLGAEPEIDAEARAPASSDPRPTPDHPAPECCGVPMRLTNGPRGWFWGCALWRTSRCRGLSLDEARASWLLAQQAEAAERRKEEERAERERERLAALNDARPSLLAEPGALDRIIRASSKAPPTTKTSPHQRATTTMRDERTA